jgi:hypothetical protein
VTTTLRRVLTVLLGPLWVRTFRDPVREGHLRLDSLSRAERQLARFGLVLLAVLLGSVLFADTWRRGTLLQLTGENSLRFVPVAVLPITLFAFLVGWVLICWGALDASPLVRVVMAGLFLTTGSVLTLTSASGLGQGSWVLEHGGTLIRVGYLVVPGALALSALLHPLVRARPRSRATATILLRLVVVGGLLLQYGTLLGAHVDAERHGFPLLVPGLLDATITQINALLLPLVYVAAISVIDFALDVSTSLTEPTRVLSRARLLLVLMALLAAKVVVQVLLKLDDWAAVLTYQPVAFVRTAACVVLLALLVAAVTRFPASEDYALAKERAMYGSGFVLASPYVLNLLGLGVAFFMVGQLDSEVANGLIEGAFYGWLGTEGLAIVSALVVVAGVVLMRRAKGGFGDELGSALVVVGGWCLAQLLVPTFDLELGFSYPAVDLVVTVAVLLLLVIRWRSLSPAALVAMMTVVVFSWLVVSRGDYISYVGGLVGLPAILVVVFGVLLTLASGSSFASKGSKRLPTDARPMLFVGYLLLSVVILLWVEVTHEPGQDADALSGFFFLGIPMAAWLAGRRIVNRPTSAVDGEPGAVLEEAGDRVG